MQALAEAIPAYPFERPPLVPPPVLDELRAGAPFKQVRLWDGSIAWIVSRQEDFRAVLADARFSVNPLKPGFPSVSEARHSLMVQEEPTFIRLDPPDHTVLRRMLSKEFTQSRINGYRPMVQQVVDDLLDEMVRKGAPADLYHDFALPIPSIVISHILGVPYEDHDFFQDRGTKKLAYSAHPDVPVRAAAEMREYIGELIARKEREPGDDLLSRLIEEQLRPGHLARDEAVRMAELLLIAGHETTANMIALGTLSLLLDRAQFDYLRDDPALSARAVEEMLRFHSIVQYGLSRVATEDVEINGQLIREGEGVISLINAANWDPTVHPNPETFDVRKKRTMHVAFGFGIHQCLGQPLARLEMDVVFSTLPNRLPSLDLAVPAAEIDFKRKALVYGVETLPVTWSEGQAS